MGASAKPDTSIAKRLVRSQKNPQQLSTEKAMANETSSQPTLKRVLHLPALVLYGIILIQPTAPMPLFGAAAV
jgi:hypothetical protein